MNKTTFISIFFLLVFCNLFSQNDFLKKHTKGFLPINFLSDYCEKNDNKTTYFYLKFKKLPTKSEIEQFEKNGVFLLDYFQDLSYCTGIKKQENLGFLNSVEGLLFSTIKNEDKCLNFKTADLTTKDENYRLSFYSLSKYADFKQTLEKLKITQSDTLGKTFYISANKQQIQNLLESNDLEYIELHVNQDKAEGLVDLANHRSNVISDQHFNGRHYNGEGLNVAIQDDGQLGPHIDHTGRLKKNPSENNGAHGDLCAGILSGSGNKNPTARGHAWGADLFAYAYGTHPLFQSGFLTNRYVEDSIYVTSTSYADGCNNHYNIESRDLDLQITNLPYLMHVFSAGNDGEKNCSYGAGDAWGTISGGNKMAKNVICVGSVTEKDILSSFSSRGPAQDGRLKPEVCSDGSTVYTTGTNNFYNSVSGTSMSCPAVAGLFVQLQQAYKEINGFMPTSDIIKACVMNSAEDLGNKGPDFKYGYGRVNGLKSLKCIENNTIFTGSLSTGTTVSIPLNLPLNVKEVKIMVYWHDDNAVPGSSALDLINDIDMYLSSPQGDVFPWILDPSPAVVAQYNPAIRGIDHLNNHEQITISNPPSGSYSIELSGFSIPSGSQNYVVVYEYLMDEIEIIYPFGGEGLAEGEVHILRWDTPSNTENFTLEISQNNGVDWSVIATNVPGNDRFYELTLPSTLDVSGNCLFKVSNGLISGVGQKFSIINLTENLKIDWLCSDSLQISWSPVLDATEYDVFLLGEKYMDSIATTDETHFVITGLNPTKEDWFSIRARGINNAVSRRCTAIKKDEGLFNCVGETDLVLYKVLNPSGIVQDCMDLDSAKIEITVINQSFNPVSNFDLSFQKNMGQILTENYSGTITAFDTLTLEFEQTTSFSVSGIDSFKIWLSYGSESYRNNDTLYSRVGVIPGTTASYPFVQDFETFALCDTNEACERACGLSNGWFNEINAVTDEIDWRTQDGATPSSQTGPQMDTIPGTSTGKYLYLQAGDCNNFTGKMLSPCIDLSQSTYPSLSFYYHMYGSNMGTLSVDVFSNGKWYLDYLPMISGNQGFYWKKAQLNLLPFVGQKIILRFRGEVNGNYLSDIAIDNVEVKEDISLNVEIINKENNISIFPNPSNASCTILGITNFEMLDLTDLLGKKIPLNFLESKENFLEINTANLTNGIYFINIVDGEKTITKRLIIQHR